MALLLLSNYNEIILSEHDTRRKLKEESGKNNKILSKSKTGLYGDSVMKKKGCSLLDNLNN